MPRSTTFLFSIDLEDIRLRLSHPERYEERVPLNTHRYLDWLRKYGFQCTFFVTGDVATLYPSLIEEIVAEGHEIACHTNNHLPLDQQSPEAFKADLAANLEVLYKAGAKPISGFRAPVFSLTPETAWAYDVLSELGFRYSCSVLPAKNPLYGWEDFGFHPRMMNANILEIPLTVGHFGPMRLPVGGGVYFRVLPFPCIEWVAKKRLRAGAPVIGYFHPYDIDWEQERYINPGIGENRWFNYLMYFNRKGVFSRLDKMVGKGLTVTTYARFLDENAAAFHFSE
jgi:polysaccharide deacetylase family protein (PEP-CTERM system associated)